MGSCILVTGGAGFIGSNFVLRWVEGGRGKVVNLDKLTYAGNLGNLASLDRNTDHIFVHGDIRDRSLTAALLAEHRPWAIVHFAAETHVDRSIVDPGIFVQTNIEGTFSMLAVTLAYYNTLRGDERAAFRFLHISTDEVYGTLSPSDPPFHENTPFAPNSPYAASKAASDHLVRAWVRTYGLPALIAHCSNNYGPLQFPEKLMPRMIANALAGKTLPIYGDGLQVRDWLYVSDHCLALERILERGQPGESYNIGGGEQRTNLDVARTLCALLDELSPSRPDCSYRELIRFVEDRPGHDRRYAIDASKLQRELGWRQRESFATGLRKTVQWYLAHPAWLTD